MDTLYEVEEGHLVASERVNEIPKPIHHRQIVKIISPHVLLY